MATWPGGNPAGSSSCTRNDPDARARFRTGTGNQHRVQETELVTQPHELTANQVAWVNRSDPDQNRGSDTWLESRLLERRPADKEAELDYDPGGGDLGSAAHVPPIRASAWRCHFSIPHAVPISTKPPTTKRIPVPVCPPMRSKNRVTTPKPTAATPMSR